MYYLKKKDGDSVYSVDRFTFDFYFLPEGGLYDLLKTSLDLLTLEYRQQFSVQNFSTNRLGFEKLVYQFDHLHVDTLNCGDVKIRLLLLGIFLTMMNT